MNIERNLKEKEQIQIFPFCVIRKHESEAKLYLNNLTEIERGKVYD